MSVPMEEMISTAQNAIVSTIATTTKIGKLPNQLANCNQRRKLLDH